MNAVAVAESQGNGSAWPHYEGGAKRAPRGRAREAAMPADFAPRVISIDLPKTSRRTPLAMVNIGIGPLVLALGVIYPRSGWLTVRPLLSAAGLPAVTAEGGLWAEIEALAIAAVRADSAARHHLQGHRKVRFQANP